ncbi:ninjurin-2-like [Saccoglossus kowalevskii]|uniref:Uncharacterized protein LOC100372383 n=1 Tax=Saccoglossus kowalevskii TaxID=10224 RepID=A0ABM0GV90_SACKO|nr:PREDICTED: uncharacterized protein LOC100372383 [Saccoglossus kowalevskii]
MTEVVTEPNIAATPAVTTAGTASPAAGGGGSSGLRPGGKKKKYNANNFAKSKNTTHGMTDFVLLTRNLSLLKRLLELPATDRDDFFIIEMVLLGLSVVMQITNGLLMFASAQKNLDDEEEKEEADDLNILSGILNFLVISVNIAISAFSGMS